MLWAIMDGSLSRHQEEQGVGTVTVLRLLWLDGALHLVHLRPLIAQSPIDGFLCWVRALHMLHMYSLDVHRDLSRACCCRQSSSRLRACGCCTELGPLPSTAPRLRPSSAIRHRNPFPIPISPSTPYVRAHHSLTTPSQTLPRPSSVQCYTALSAPRPAPIPDRAFSTPAHARISEAILISRWGTLQPLRPANPPRSPQPPAARGMLQRLSTAPPLASAI